MTALLMTADRISIDVKGWFKRLAQANARRVMVNQTITELNKLTDRELNDIGISRCMIRSVAEGTFRD